VSRNIILRNLGLQEYLPLWQQMQQFTAERTAETPNEIWITEHPAVYTQGLNGKAEHLLSETSIPVIATDRGGQITYHGPGQLIIYLLADLKRLNLGPRQMVSILEQAVIDSLNLYGIKAQAKAEAPGVYIAEQKIASLGLRIKRGCCYHGLSLNNNMDLSPFRRINPCGYAGMEVTQLADLGVNIHTHELAVPIVHRIIKAIES
jgi:lipoyl(octanoyl) transferase